MFHRVMYAKNKKEYLRESKFYAFMWKKRCLIILHYIYILAFADGEIDFVFGTARFTGRFQLSQLYLIERKKINKYTIEYYTPLLAVNMNNQKRTR